MRFEWKGFIKATKKRQQDIAEMLGVNQGQISKYSVSGNLKKEDYETLCETFGHDMVDQYVIAAEKYDSSATFVPSSGAPMKSP